jgi:hypothetical protein
LKRVVETLQEENSRLPRMLEIFLAPIMIAPPPLTWVNSTNVLDEGLRIGGVGRRMNSKVKSVKQGVY